MYDGLVRFGVTVLLAFLVVVGCGTAPATSTPVVTASPSPSVSASPAAEPSPSAAVLPAASCNPVVLLGVNSAPDLINQFAVAFAEDDPEKTADFNFRIGQFVHEVRAAVRREPDSPVLTEYEALLGDLEAGVDAEPATLGDALPVITALQGIYDLSSAVRADCFEGQGRPSTPATGS